MTPASPRRRLTALLLLIAVPWTVVLVDGAVSLIFLPALVDYIPGATQPIQFVAVWDLFAARGGLPRNPELWPASVVLYLLGLASAASGVLFDREDLRFTAGAVTFAALAHLGVAAAFRHRLAYTAFPVGPFVALSVVWWYYWPAVRAAIFAPEGD